MHPTLCSLPEDTEEFAEKEKSTSILNGSTCHFGRSSGICTHGLFVPNEARYQLRYAPKIPQLFGCGLVGDERIELPQIPNIRFCQER